MSRLTADYHDLGTFSETRCLTGQVWVFRSPLARQAGYERNQEQMQPGAEYIVVLNDRQLRDGLIREQEREARSRRATSGSFNSVALSRLVHAMAALRHGVVRFSPSRPGATA